MGGLGCAILMLGVARRGEGRGCPARLTNTDTMNENVNAEGRGCRLLSVRALIVSRRSPEWVWSSPVIAGAPAPLKPSSYTRHHHHQNQRRNSSPKARRVKYEFVEALTRGLKGCAVESDSNSEESSEGGP